MAVTKPKPHQQEQMIPEQIHCPPCTYDSAATPRCATRCNIWRNGKRRAFSHRQKVCKKPASMLTAKCCWWQQGSFLVSRDTFWKKLCVFYGMYVPTSIQLRKQQYYIYTQAEIRAETSQVAEIKHQTNGEISNQLVSEWTAISAGLDHLSFNTLRSTSP